MKRHYKIITGSFLLVFAFAMILSMILIHPVSVISLRYELSDGRDITDECETKMYVDDQLVANGHVAKFDTKQGAFKLAYDVTYNGERNVEEFFFNDQFSSIRKWNTTLMKEDYKVILVYGKDYRIGF